MIYYYLGKHEDAVKNLKENRSTIKEVLGQKHPLYLRNLRFIGKCLFMFERYKEALEIHQKCIILAKETLGEKHSDYLKCLYNSNN